MLVTTVLIAYLYLLLPNVSARCYQPGPSYSLLELKKEDRAVVELINSLTQAFNSHNLDVPAGVDEKDSSYSIALTSVHETLWTFHKTAPKSSRDKRGTNEVNGDTAFRIASVSKIFTTLSALSLAHEGKLHFDDPITKYIKELPDKDRYEHDEIHWRNITLRSLASQMSGLKRESLKSTSSWDYSKSIDGDEYGLPKVDPEQIPACAGSTDDNPEVCSRKEFFEDITSLTPLFDPNYKSTYGNVNFVLLGEAAAKAAGVSYPELLKSTLEKLNMTKSSLEKPKDSRGAISSEKNDWGLDIGLYNATGGIYSTSTDLSKFLRYVLQNDLLRDAWLHPGSYMSSISSFYSMPWETFRSTEFLPGGRPIVFYTKGGSLTQYYSIIMLVPELNIGLTILVAGKSNVKSWLMEKVTSVLIPAVDAIGGRYLQQTMSGVYEPVESEEDDKKTELVLGVSWANELYIDSWKSKGKDVLPLFLRLMEHRGIDQGEDWIVQLIPTGRSRDEKGREQRWRAMYVPRKKEGGKSGKWDSFCLEDWDNGMWGGLPINEFVFKWDDDGEVVGLELPGWRTKLERTSWFSQGMGAEIHHESKEDL